MRDVALLLEVIAGHDVRDAASLPVPPRRFDTTPGSLEGLRIGFTPDLGFAAVSPDVREAFRRAVDALDELGAELVADDAASIRKCWSARSSRSPTPNRRPRSSGRESRAAGAVPIATTTT